MKTKKFLASLLLTLLFASTTLPTLGAEQPITPSGLTQTQMETQINALAHQHIGTSVAGTAITVVHNGEIIFSSGFGYANTTTQTPIDPATTVFQLASINKAFVWVAVMQLAEQNLINLDAPITNYLPPSFSFQHPFTMRDLLNHTPGFADVIASPPFDGTNLPTLEESLLATQPPQIFLPGTVSAYSNWGSALAGLAVAHVSGQSFVDYELNNILLPANMQNTLNLPHWLNNPQFLANRARGYAGNEGDFRPQREVYVLDYPAGALNGTAEDMARFIKALTPPAGQSGPLFNNPQTLQTMFSNSSPDPANHPMMNHGFFSYSGVLDGFGHGGNLPGFSTDFVIVPEARFGFVVLTNAAGEINLLPALQELLLGTNPPVTPAENITLPSASQVEGHFVSARRFDGGLFEFVGYAGLTMPIANVTALDNNLIRLSIGQFGSVIYRQTAPHTFHVYDATDSPFLGTFFPEIRFRVEDGTATQILTQGMNFTSLPAGRTMPALITYAIISLAATAFFLLTPLTLLVIFIINKIRKKDIPKSRLRLLNLGLILTGTLFILNISATSIGLFTGAFILTVLNIQVALNYALTLIALTLTTLSALTLRKEWHNTKPTQKTLLITTTALLALLIFTLQNWHFFTFL